MVLDSAPKSCHNRYGASATKEFGGQGPWGQGEKLGKEAKQVLKMTLKGVNELMKCDADFKS